MPSVPYKLALLLENKVQGSKHTHCEPYTGPIPDIFAIYKAWDPDMTGSNYSWICMKNYKDSEYYKEEYGDKYCENAGGFMIEYQDVNRTQVETVFISDDSTAGNFINGELLRTTYPALQTIILDRYRGYPSMLYDAEALHVKNFIAVSTQGWDNPFEYLRAMPHLECAMFESEDCYTSEYSIGNSALNKVAWLDEFVLTTSIMPNLYQLLFFTSGLPKEIPDAFPAPPGWNTWFLKLPGLQSYYWVVYEKNNRTL